MKRFPRLDLAVFIVVVAALLVMGCAPGAVSEPLPIEEPTPLPPLDVEPLESVDKMALFTGTTARLRGANVHPCTVFAGDACVETIGPADIQALPGHPFRGPALCDR
ncbi:MAG: hypothetical protein GYB64_11545 [Chloroflexi bacterium]|nr:hypothetical protein [Chloroflexota bacterium]